MTPVYIVPKGYFTIKICAKREEYRKVRGVRGK